MLYITSRGLIYFVTENLYLLTLFTYITSPLPPAAPHCPPLTATYLFPVSIGIIFF